MLCRLAITTLLSLALTVSAIAHDVSISQIRQDVLVTQRLAEQLRRDSSLEGRFITADEARSTFEEAVYHWLTGDFEQAAERFFVLRSLLVDEALRRDTEWYLADSLGALGHTELAASVLHEIIETPAHPFQREAAHRLLELTAAHDSPEAFQDLWAHLDELGLIDDSDALGYSLGRAAYALDQLDRSKEAFQSIPEGSSIYPKAQYFLGAIATRTGHLESAREHFDNVLVVGVTGPADREVRDLAQLAVARLAYEQQAYDQAAEAYDLIGGDSPVLSDALYELVWTHIRRDDHEAALRAIDLFLLHFPASAPSGRLMVVRGHLHMKLKDWRGAEEAYTTVDDLFSGVRAEVEEGFQTGASQGQIPAWVLAALGEEPEVQRALAIREELTHQAGQLAEADAVAEEIQTLMSERATLRHEARLRGRAYVVLAEVADQQLDLVQLETSSVWESHGRVARGRARAMKTRHQNLDDQLVRLREAELDQGRETLQTALDDLLAHTQRLVQDVREARTQSHHDAVYDDLDRLYSDLQETQGHVAAMMRLLDTGQGATPVKERVEQELDRLDALHSDYTSVADQGARTWELARHQGAETVLAYIDDNLLDARSGLADAAWSGLMDTQQERRDVLAEREERLHELELLFAQARSRL